MHAPGLTEADRQLEGDRQRVGLSEQVLGDGQHELVDRQPRRPLPAAHQVAEARQAINLARVDILLVQPVAAEPRPEVVLQRLATAQPARACLHGGPGRRVGAVGTPPGQVAVGKREGRAGIGQGAQHAAEHLGHLARGAGAVQQALHAAEPALPDRLHQIARAVVAGRQHRHGRLLVGGQEAAERVGDCRRLALRRERLVDEGDGGPRIGGVGLRIAGRRRADVRQAERVARLHHRVAAGRPVDHPIGHRDDAGRRTAGLGELPRRHVVAAQEFAQEPRVGGGERLEDRLIGVADAHPVAPLAGQQREDPLLHLAGVLRLILQDVGPPLAEPDDQFFVLLQQVQRAPDQIVEVQRAAVGQGALVVGVQRRADLRQAGVFVTVGARARTVISEQRLELIRPHPLALGIADEIGAQILDQVRQPLAAHERAAPLRQLRIQQPLAAMLVAAQPGDRDLAPDLGALLLIDDPECIGQPHRFRPLAHDVGGKRVQRAHPVADARHQGARRGGLIDAAGQIVAGGVDQRDHQDLLLAGEDLQVQDAVDQHGDGFGLAAAGHRGDPHQPAAVGQHRALARARREPPRDRSRRRGDGRRDRGAAHAGAGFPAPAGRCSLRGLSTRCACTERSTASMARRNRPRYSEPCSFTSQRPR